VCNLGTNLLRPILQYYLKIHLQWRRRTWKTSSNRYRSRDSNIFFV